MLVGALILFLQFAEGKGAFGSWGGSGSKDPSAGSGVKDAFGNFGGAGAGGTGGGVVTIPGGDQFDKFDPDDKFDNLRTTPTTTEMQMVDFPCERGTGQDCVDLCSEYVKQECDAFIDPSPTSKPCPWASNEQKDECPPITIPEIMDKKHRPCWSKAGMICIDGDIRHQAAAGSSEAEQRTMDRCERIMEDSVQGTANNAAVDMTALKMLLENANCPADLLKTLQNDVETAIGQNAQQELKECKEAAADENARDECQRLAMIAVADGTGKPECKAATACLGDKRKVLDSGAMATISGILKDCLNKTTSGATDRERKPTQAELKKCIQDAAVNATVLGLDELQVREVLQKLAQMEARKKLDVCLKAQNKSALVMTYKYSRHKMRNDDDTLSAYVTCMGLAQLRYERYGGKDRFEAFLKDLAKDIGSSTLKQCQGNSTTARQECKDEAKNAIRDSGVADELVNFIMQETAATEAWGIMKSCKKAGGTDNNCTEEAKNKFSEFGGDVSGFGAAIEGSRKNDVEKAMSACKGVGEDDSKCRADAQQAYVAAGGNPDKFAIDLEKGAGKKAAEEASNCYKEFGEQVNAESMMTCNQRAKDSCVGAGGREKDCALMQKEAARDAAGDTYATCLQDAGCSFDKGTRTCTNATLEASCVEAAGSELKFGTGKGDAPTATEIKNAKNRADEEKIGSEISTCAGEELSAGTVMAMVNGAERACTAADAAYACKVAAAQRCDDRAKAFFESRGGDPMDYEMVKETASKIAVKDTMKSCVREKLRAELVPFVPETGNSVRNCTLADADDDSAAAFKPCMNAAQRACDEQAKAALAEQGSDVDFYEYQKTKAANIELGDLLASCVTDRMANTTELAMTSACTETIFNCDGENGRRMAASSLCKAAAKGDFAMAGGTADDLEFQALQRCRETVANTVRNCKGSSAVELKATSTFTNLPSQGDLEGDFEVVYSDADGVLTVGQQEAACRKQAREQMETMGISKEDIPAELRRAASNAAQERMQGCLASKNITEDTARTNKTLFLEVRAACMANFSEAVKQAGSLVGNLMKDFEDGARTKMRNTIRECVKSKKADSGTNLTNDEKTECEGKGEKAFFLCGGDPDKLQDEKDKGARDVGRDAIKSCLSGSGKVTSVLKQAMLYGTQEEKQSTADDITACLTTAGAEILDIGTDSSTLVDTLKTMRKESALEMLDDTFERLADDVAAGIDRAILEIQVTGAPDDDEAEEELAEGLDCGLKPVGVDDCPESTMQLPIAGMDRCCPNAWPSTTMTIDMQEVAVESKGVEGNGVKNLVGSGSFRKGQSEFQKFCLMTTDGLYDDGCDEVTQQTVNEVRTDGTAAMMDTDRTSVAANTFRGKHDGTEIYTGMQRTGTTAGRGEYSGYLDSDNAKFDGTSKISGEGRCSLSKAKIDGDALWESDVAISDIDVQDGKTLEFRGNTIINREPDVMGNIDGDVMKRAGGQLKCNSTPCVVFDNAEDSLGDYIGENIRARIPDRVKNNRTKRPSLVSRCRRYCRSESSIKTIVANCRNFDPRDRNETLRKKMKWAIDTGNVDCKRPFKRCVKVCIMGVRREINQTLGNMTMENGGITASAGLKLFLKNLNITGEKGYVCGTPKDDATDESGADISGPSVVIENLPNKKKMDIGCDCTVNVSAGHSKRACVGVPPDADIDTIFARVSSNNDGPDKVTGRRFVQYMADTSGTLGRRLSGSGDQVSITVEDDNGNDVSAAYKPCCYDDGIGMGQLSDPESQCPPCSASTSSSSSADTGTVTTSADAGTSTTSSVETGTVTGTTLSVETGTSTGTTSLDGTGTTPSAVTGTDTTPSAEVGTSTSASTQAGTVPAVTSTTAATVQYTGTGTTLEETTTTTTQNNIEGTISLQPSNVDEFMNSPEVKTAMRKSIANMSGVSDDRVTVEFRLGSRRLRSSNERKLQDTVHVDYVISLPPNTDPQTYVTAIQSTSKADIASSITQALVAVGITQTVQVTAVTAVHVVVTASTVTTTPRSVEQSDARPRRHCVPFVLLLSWLCSGFML